LLAAPVDAAARALLGTLLVVDGDGPGRRRRVGRIVEVEAYSGQDDAASHARFGRTARNGVMFGPPGLAYVYLVYGMHECLNVVCDADGRAAAVLVRAVEPIEGAAEMRTARLAVAGRRARSAETLARAERRIAALPDARLASGPGLVTAAFGIDRTLTGADLLDPAAGLRLEHGDPPAEVMTTPRVGIDYASEPSRSRTWRFLDLASPSISIRPASPRR
jgi:DNA-3-methyladenine glycosylase